MFFLLSENDPILCEGSFELFRASFEMHFFSNGPNKSAGHNIFHPISYFVYKFLNTVIFCVFSNEFRQHDCSCDRHTGCCVTVKEMPPHKDPSVKLRLLIPVQPSESVQPPRPCIFYWPRIYCAYASLHPVEHNHVIDSEFLFSEVTEC